MKTFTIDEENNITVFATKKEAAAASITPFDPFTNANELAELAAEWPVQRLVEIWNRIPGVTEVSKFASRKIATERIWNAIHDLAVSAPVPHVQEPAGETPEPATAVEPEVTVEAGAEETTVAADVGSVPPIEATEPVTAKTESETPVPPAEPVADVVAQASDVASAAKESNKKAGRGKKAPRAPKVAKGAKSESGPREGSKTAKVVAMLQRDGGATLDEIMSKMGWQKHTVRGFMAGAMKKAGYAVESFKPEGGERSYRIGK